MSAPEKMPRWLWLPVFMTLVFATLSLLQTHRTRVQSRHIATVAVVLDSLATSEMRLIGLQHAVSSLAQGGTLPTFAWVPTYMAFSRYVAHLSDSVDREAMDRYLDGVRALMARAGADYGRLRQASAGEWQGAKEDAAYALRDVAAEVNALRRHVRDELSPQYVAVAKAWRRSILMVWITYLLLVVTAVGFAVGLFRPSTEQAAALPAQERPVVDLATLGIAAEKLFDFARVGIAVIDPEGRFVACNAALQAMLGYSEEQFKHLTLSDVSPGMQPRSRLRRVSHVTDDAFREAETFAHRDGTLRWGRCSLTAFSRDTRYCLVTIEDISEQKRYQDLSAEIRSREEELSRLKAAFLANLNHELRTPLTVILGYASILEEEVQPEQQEHVEAIGRSGRQLLDSFNALLELAGLENGRQALRRETVDVRLPLGDAVAKIEAEASAKGLRLIYQAPPVPVTVGADAVGLQRMAIHLLSNAVKFTERGFIQLRIEPVGEVVKLHFRDTGIGIPPDVLPGVWEAFRQGSLGETRQYGGIGIGLTIVQQLVTRMGGTLEVESKPGQGTHLVVTFPCLAGSAAEIPPASKNAAEVLPAERFFPRIAA